MAKHKVDITVGDAIEYNAFELQAVYLAGK